MITVNQPIGELSGSSTICAGEPAQITFNLTGTPPWNITYTENGGNQQDVTAYSSPFNQDVSPLVTTLYDFIYFEDNFCPGIASGEAIVTVNPDPSASAGDDKTIPNGTSTYLEGEVSGGSGSYAYQWQPEDKLVNPQVLEPLTVNLFSSTLFTLVATDNNGGCYDQDEVLVTITGGVLSCNSLADPDVICSGETSQLRAIASGGSGIYSYHWEPAFKLINPDIPQPETVNLYETTLFTLSVTDAETGCVCSETDDMTVIISGNALNVNPSAQSIPL